MDFKLRLLATAAIPFIALAGYSLPASAAMIKPSTDVRAQSPVIMAQSEEEQAPKKRRNKNADDQQADQNNAASDQDEQPKKRKNRQAQSEEQQSDQDNAASDQDQQPKKRKNRQAQSEEQQSGQDNAASDQDQQPKKRKNKQAQSEEQQVDPANAAAEEEMQPKKRNKNKAAAQEEQQADPANAVSDEDIVNKSKRDKQAKQKNQADDQNAADSEEPVRKNRKKQAADDAQQADEAKPGDNNAVSDEDIVKKSKERKNKRDREKQQADDNQSADDGNQKAETPAETKKKEQVAKDPSKTTDTVELPVENGAAVLDSDKDADNSGDAKVREKRKRERQEVKEVRVPKSDKDAQKTDVKIVIKPVMDDRGEKLDDFRRYEGPRGRDVGKDGDLRVIFNLDGRIVIRDDDRNRIGRDGPIRYERLGEGRIREIVVRPNGDRIVTVRNKWGEIIRRSRIDNREREIVIFYSPDLERGRDQLFLRDPGDDLPPMRLRIPVEDYIIDVSSNPDRDYEEFLSEPPVEPVERVYSVDEVKYSARLRDKVRRIDLDTITFDTGSAEISEDQASSLREVATAIGDLLDKDPGETFLIEGHTDAVGSDESNLVLSDERAESIANVLTDLFNIPAENLVTQGYGERFLKVDTDEEERMNRRVTIRRISPLVRPVEAAEN